MRIAAVDPTDESTFRAWFAAFDAVEAEYWPDEPRWQFSELWAAANRPDPPVATEHLLAVQDAAGGRRVAGFAQLELPQRDNMALAEGSLGVLPGSRRRGVGGALLAALEDRARAAGRRTMTLTLDLPARFGDDSPGSAFAARHGYRCAQLEQRRDLTLPVAAGLLDALEGASRPAAAGYEVRGWRDRCPDELVADRARLAVDISADAPLGDLDRDVEAWDVRRVRDDEALRAEQGRTRLAAGAVERASGRLVAVTEIGYLPATPERAYQWDTVVAAGHRGHRLGTLLKVVNLRRLQQALPDCRVVSTWNAADNRHMIAVNDALGCRVVGSHITWQRRL